MTSTIYRTRHDDGYNASFGLQWNTFRRDQIEGGRDLTLKRLAEIKLPLNELRGKRVLDAGCGAGRFTKVFAEEGAYVWAFDYSSAIEACYDNNKHFSNVIFWQCDILDMPFSPESFDLVFCFGVLQHTPDPKASILALSRMVRPCGWLSIDIYAKDGLIRPWKSKYLWRPLTTRIAPQKLLRFLEWFIPKWLPIDTAIKRIPILGNFLGALIPCWNYHWTGMTKEEKRTWAIMDTFDALAARYDKAATLEEVRSWFTLRDWSEIDVHPGSNGIVANVRRR